MTIARTLTDHKPLTTDHFSVGTEPGLKFEKAKQLGVKILDENMYSNFVNEYGVG